MKIVRSIREHTIKALSAAIERVPMAPERIVDAYRAKGMLLPQWDLADDEQALLFAFALRDYAPTPEELRSADLLRACVAAEELGDVPAFADQQLGRDHREGQRLKGAQTGAPKNVRERAAKLYWDRVRNGQTYGALKAISESIEFQGKHFSEKTIKAWAMEFRPDDSIAK